MAVFWRLVEFCWLLLLFLLLFEKSRRKYSFCFETQILRHFFTYWPKIERHYANREVTFCLRNSVLQGSNNYFVSDLFVMWLLWPRLLLLFSTLWNRLGPKVHHPLSVDLVYFPICFLNTFMYTGTNQRIKTHTHTHPCNSKLTCRNIMLNMVLKNSWATQSPQAS